MWIIVVSDDQSESRNTILDSILETTKPKEDYLSLRVTNWGSTTSIHFAKVWKTQSGAKRIVKLFESNKEPNNWYKDKFYFVRRKHLHVRKMTKEEWNSIIDGKLSLLNNNYIRQKSKLEQKKII